jgi:hypothetical protein
MTTNKTQSIFKIGIILLPIALFAAFGAYNGKNFLEGPKINVEFPSDRQTISNSYIEVKGSAKNISKITLNGRQIFTDKNGFFKENLLLASGYNIIQIEASDKFGRNITKQLQTVLK